MPAIFLEHLAKTETYVGTLLHVAQNPNTHEETLDFLAKSKFSGVRYWVAKHPNTSNKTINYLFGDGDTSVVLEAMNAYNKRYPKQ